MTVLSFRVSSLRSFSRVAELIRAVTLPSGGKNGDQPRDDVASQYRAIYFVIETTEEPNSARLPRSRPPRHQTCRYMLGAHIYVYTYDAIPIYLPILTYPSCLPTYLIIPSGPLGAISDLHTERRDGFTAWLCTTSIYSSPGRAEPSRAESRRGDFAPFCSYFRKSEERLANSGHCRARRVFSSSYSRSLLRASRSREQLLFALRAERARNESVLSPCPLRFAPSLPSSFFRRSCLTTPGVNPG